MAEPSDDDDLDELREILREMMDKSPDPYRPEELARIMSDLIERVFPNIGVLKLEDEKEIDRLVAVITDWVMNAYNDLLEEYPEKALVPGIRVE